MSVESPKPLIGIASSTLKIAEHRTQHHSTGEKYVDAVQRGSGAVPMLIPVLGDAYDFADLAARLDGLMLTGGRANVEPHHYGGPPFPDDEVRDPARDATVLPLIRSCIDQGVPIFGVCRGIQEINVALGGTLHYRVHLVPGMMDHRMPQEGDIDFKFGLRHDIALAQGGLLAELCGLAECKVNSAHGQGVEKLAPGCCVEALAPDGLIEAIRVDGAKSFTVGVQWHAEWRFDDHPLSNALFAAFGEAASSHAARRKVRRLSAA
jgi:putative glutamine amidotransferase